MNRLQKRLSQFKPANLTLTVSIGISTMTGEASQTLNSLFELADGAMYQAKMSARNCVKIYQENN